MFFDTVVAATWLERLLFNEHFSMNGTLIAAGASLENVTSKKPARLLHCLTILITQP
jgi:hypothetical protein